MIYALASAATDPLEMLSRSRRNLPVPLAASFPRAKRPGETRSYASGILLTYRLHPISHARNIANRNGRASARVRARLHLHTGRIVPFRVQRISLVLAAAPEGPREAVCYRAEVQQGIPRCVTIATFGIKPRTDREAGVN